MAKPKSTPQRIVRRFSDPAALVRGELPPLPGEEDTVAPLRNDTTTSPRSDVTEQRGNRQGKPRPGAVRFTLVIPEEMRDTVKAIALMEGCPVSAVIEEALAAYLEGHELRDVISEVVQCMKSGTVK